MSRASVLIRAALVAVLVAPIGSALPASAATTVPRFSHIYVIVMENKEYGSIVGNADAPYLNALVRHHGLATAYTGLTHPSQPNYFALFGGSTFGVTDNNLHDISARNLADQLRDHGKTWHVYAQNLPRVCSKAASANDARVDLVGRPGTYVRRHEPAISFTDISRDPRRCDNITRLSTFNAGEADFQLIIPNLTNDMHDGTVAQGDDFLHDFVPHITGSSAWRNSLLVITWDEGETNIGGGGQIPTIVISPWTPPGFRSSTAHNHYSLLRTMQRAWGLGCLHETCGANNLHEFFS